MTLFKLTSKLFTTSTQYLLRNGASSIQNHHPRSFHASSIKLTLWDFFDDPNNYGKDKIKTGCAWSKDLLRKKNAVELHQLWFVLLKERNMLQTQEYFCMDNDEPIPGPDRLDKVAESMSNLRDVIDEREKAKNMLMYGRITKQGGEVRKSPTGAVYWYKYKEHLIPKELQKKVFGHQPAEIATFPKKIEEMQIRMKEKREKNVTRLNWLVNKQYQQQRMSNPSLPRQPPQWFRNRFRCTLKFGIHPRMRVLIRDKHKHDTRKHFVKTPKKTKERV